MKVILDKDFAKISLYEDFKILEVIWKRKVTAEEYKYTFEFAVIFSEENAGSAENFISDIRLQGIVGPAERKWFQEIMIPRATKSGVKHAAVVFSGGVFAKYYLNNITGTTKKLGIDMKFFNDLNQAHEWIKSFY